MPMRFATITPKLRCWATACLLTSGGAFLSCQAAPVYHLGEGRTIGPVNVAGYSNLQADLPHDAPDALNLDLSCFVSGHYGRYANPFLEAEIDGLTIARQAGAPNTGTLTIERLYNDFYLSPSTMLRAGKMLTPVGDWNLTHAAPLVWTVTRPLATYYSFPEFVSGAALRYQWNHAGMWDLQLYVQPGDDAFRSSASTNVRRYSRVAGGNFRYSWDPLLRNRIGFSWQVAHLPQTGQQQRLASIYGGFTTGPVRWSFQGDLVDVQGNTTSLAHQREHGAYLQAVYAIHRHWFVVAQVEKYQTLEFRSSTRRRLLGIVYRPQHAVSWKLDVLHANGAPIGPPSGVYAAWAVLF